MYTQTNKNYGNYKISIYTICNSVWTPSNETTNFCTRAMQTIWCNNAWLHWFADTYCTKLHIGCGERFFGIFRVCVLCGGGERLHHVIRSRVGGAWGGALRTAPRTRLASLERSCEGKPPVINNFPCRRWSYRVNKTRESITVAKVNIIESAC